MLSKIGYPLNTPPPILSGGVLVTLRSHPYVSQIAKQSMLLILPLFFKGVAPLRFSGPTLFYIVPLLIQYTSLSWAALKKKWGLAWRAI
jgi:hypothetical protein